MSDFERFLKQQSFRDLPPEWREEILAARPVETPARNETAAVNWLWPSPIAWGAMAAIWVFFFLLESLSDRPLSHLSSGNLASAARPTPDPVPRAFLHSPGTKALVASLR